MRLRHVLPLVLALGAVACGMQAVHAQESAPYLRPWKEQAQDAGLSGEDIAALEENRILITDEAYQQVFSPYVSGDMPLFITSDSLLNAYHVLYEESVLRLETVMASRLPEILRLILTNLESADAGLKGAPELVAGAKKRAKLVPGIALRLMDDSFEFGDEELDTIIQQEVGRIIAATGLHLPEWLATPDDTLLDLDYSRYKPRGFYTRSDILHRYFRAVSWLQSIPFRVSKDEELLAMIMLGKCLSSRKSGGMHNQPEIQAFFSTYRFFIGAGDDWDIMTAAEEMMHSGLDSRGDFLQEMRAQLEKKAERGEQVPQINDQDRYPPSDPRVVAEPNFRILSAYRTPDAVLFQRTTDLRWFERPYPNGLEVLMALGSGFAGTLLEEPQKDKVQIVTTLNRPLFRGADSLYLLYVNAIAALLDAPEPDAPEFMGSNAWRLKSCNTALAGWAQLRHTWVLQAKQTVTYACMADVPPGFVEPEPEFFSRMASLAARTSQLLDQAGAFQEDCAWMLTRIENIRQAYLAAVRDPEGDKHWRRLYADIIDSQLEHHLRELSPSRAEPRSSAFCQETAEWLYGISAAIENGQLGRYPALAQVFDKYEFDLQGLWQDLQRVSWTLEAIAHKQLRGVALDAADSGFVRDYGKSIAGIMLYGGNSYLSPNDDAPRVVDVYFNPNELRYLHVGISRPRKLYVLYPWGDATILCVGAVMPYYEFVDKERLTDETWIERLDSANVPLSPVWMAPIMSGGTL